MCHSLYLSVYLSPSLAEAQTYHVIPTSLMFLLTLAILMLGGVNQPWWAGPETHVFTARKRRVVSSHFSNSLEKMLKCGQNISHCGSLYTFLGAWGKL